MTDNARRVADKLSGIAHPTNFLREDWEADGWQWDCPYCGYLEVLVVKYVLRNSKKRTRHCPICDKTYPVHFD